MRQLITGLIILWTGVGTAGGFQGKPAKKENNGGKNQSSVLHSMVAGLDSSSLDPVLQGRVLVEEHRCVACHSTESQSLVSDSKVSPRLMDIGKRANPYFLEQFIASPSTTKPGTTMPHALASLDESKKRETSKAITHFLLSLSGGSLYRPTAPDKVAAELGQELFHTVGCVACHSPRNESGVEKMPESSTPLGNLEQKYNVESLTRFLADPHRVRPSGRMPSMNLGRKDYERIAHYLLQKTRVPGNLQYTLIQGRVWEGLDVNVEKVRAGFVPDFDLKHIKNLPKNAAILYEGFINNGKEGTAEFNMEWNGGELWVNEKNVVSLKQSNRRGVKKSNGKAALVKGWNKIRVVYFHTGKDPRFSLQVEFPGSTRKTISSSQLSISTKPIASYIPYRVDQAKAKAGANAFIQHGCVKCHDDVAAKLPKSSVYELPTRLDRLDLKNGCLATEPGRAPKFDFSDRQLQLIRTALTTPNSRNSTPSDLVNKSLVTFNCIACHDRQGLGAVSLERNSLFVGSKNELGNDGRIPPPLTLVGAKLQKGWMREVMFRGQRQRDYMATTMPQFGENNVGHLLDLFEQVDKIEPVKFEKISDLDEVKKAGQLLIGTKGFSCIACHDFNGQKAAGPGAFDIIHSTSRLKKDWFYEFMLKPNRFRKGTVMPASWPGGHVFMEDILDGDAKKQIESLWVYLEDGIRASNPEGLSRKSPELRVTNEALICRGRGTAGYRGLGVGYPERLSLAFDTQEMNLRLLWKGEFATVDNGRFFARGRDRVSFPPGIPFHRLKSLDDNWPYKRKTDYLFPQSLGYRFDGYVLDEKKRPTFLYHYGEIGVEDFFEDRLETDKSVFFQRTITFNAPKEQEEFYFRVASGSKLSRRSDFQFDIDRLKLKFEGAAGHVVRDGSPKELLLKIKLPKGKSTIKLEYRW